MFEPKLPRHTSTLHSTASFGIENLGYRKDARHELLAAIGHERLAYPPDDIPINMLI